MPSEDVLGWSGNVIAGAFDGGIAQVLYASVIKSPDLSHSQVWLEVKRTVNGSTVFHLEFIEELFQVDDGKLRRDAFMVDAGSSLDSRSGSAETGASSPSSATSVHRCVFRST